MGGALTAQGRHGKWVKTKFWSENLKVRDRLDDQGVYGRIILIRGCELDSCGAC
jgi:hypothetical protein